MHESINDAHTHAHTHTLQEYQRVIDHDRKLREFMSRKNQERTEAHLEMEARQLRKEAEKTSTRERTVMVG